MRFKVIIRGGGEPIEYDKDDFGNPFETEEAASDFGSEWCSNYDQGVEDLHNHNLENPAPEDADDVDFEVVPL